ncbi:MAG: L,D-transpeptidase family protein [Polaromonas sp.]|nr:L,D-transpeptidase family protein [Polaromonas sp.]
MQRAAAALLFLALPALCSAAGSDDASSKKSRKKTSSSVKAEKRRLAAAPAAAAVATATAAAGSRQAHRDGEAEARLIEIYKLAGQAKSREALSKAERLVNDHPNFQLAQLVYGDLLAAQARPLRTLGDVSDGLPKTSASMLGDLRQESLLRLKALRERPAPGTIPSQFIELSPRNKHAIAVDASRARLYLFENTANGLKLLGDYYISVGKAGIEKSVEGDSRTPLGVYFVTSNLDPKSLKDFYGSGALPINYPNALDLKRGKTGSGIWLHGTPPAQFARAPLASDGCVVLANPDLERIIRTVEVRTTPVVIAQSLKWVAPHSAKADGKAFEDALHAWQKARSGGDLTALTSLYASDFNSYGKSLTDWTTQLRTELDKRAGRPVQLKDLSYLRWTDANDTMVVTFGEVLNGSRTGQTRRQYWVRQGSQWKIFFEGVIG